MARDRGYYGCADKAVPAFRKQEEFDHESQRYRSPHRRSRPSRHSQGDPPHHADPRRRPVIDDMEPAADFLFFYVGFVRKTRLEFVHIDGNRVLNRAYPGRVRCRKTRKTADPSHRRIGCLLFFASLQAGIYVTVKIVFFSKKPKAKPSLRKSGMFS